MFTPAGSLAVDPNTLPPGVDPNAVAADPEGYQQWLAQQQAQQFAADGSVALPGGAVFGSPTPTAQPEAPERAPRRPSGGGGGSPLRRFVEGGLGMIDRNRNPSEPGPETMISGIPGLGNNAFAPYAGKETLMSSLGDREPARAGLVDFANMKLLDAGYGHDALPGNVQDADSIAQQQLLDPLHTGAEQGLNLLSGTAGVALGGNFQQFGDRLTNGFREGFSGQAFDASANQMGIANSSPQAATDAALANFRAQAMPENQRAANSALSRLFSTGRLGTTGGANQYGRLVEAQDRQDLQFQQAALNEGRAVQSQAANLSTGFQNQGTVNTSLGEQLLSGAYSRFGDTLGLAGDLNQSRFTRGAAAADFGRAGAQTNLQNQIGLSGLGQQLQGGDLTLALQALQGEGALQQQSRDQIATALNVGVSQANAEIGAGSNLAALAQNPNFGASPLTAIGGAIANNSGSIGNFFSNLGSTPSTNIGGTAAPLVPTSNFSNFNLADGSTYSPFG